METMGSIDHRYFSFGKSRGQTSQNRSHRGVAVEGVDFFLLNDLYKTIQCSEIFLNLIGGFLNRNGMNHDPIILKISLVKSVSRVLKV